jgi:hypothetical protein
MKIFDTWPKSGAKVRSKSFFTAILRMARAWEKLEVHDGQVQWSNGMPTIVLDSDSTSAGGTDTDKIYVGGIEYTPGVNTNNYDYIQVNADGSSSFIPAMISPMPTGSEIFNIRKNHIHISGATAGNT